MLHNSRTRWTPQGAVRVVMVPAVQGKHHRQNLHTVTVQLWICLSTLQSSKFIVLLYILLPCSSDARLALKKYIIKVSTTITDAEKGPGRFLKEDKVLRCDPRLS